jgi:hypothetical protein
MYCHYFVSNRIYYLLNIWITPPIFLAIAAKHFKYSIECYPLSENIPGPSIRLENVPSFPHAKLKDEYL